MSPDKKTGNFLNAIQKFADEQKHQIRSEVEKFKAEELKKAEDDGIRDAYALITREMSAMRSGIAIELAKKEDEGRQKLYRRREEMLDEVFKKVKGKLVEYTKTDEYKKTVEVDAKKAAEYFDGDMVVVFLKDDDSNIKGELSDIFGDRCSFSVDREIAIGGFKVQCAEKRVIIDFTLDTKLENCKEWFLENSNLRV